VIGDAAGLVANAVDIFQTIGACTMNKLNPWRNGSLYEQVAKLEKAGIQKPAAFAMIEEILDTLEAIEREDAFRESVRKAGGQAASQS
jgi:hypothetical protein